MTVTNLSQSNIKALTFLGGINPSIVLRPGNIATSISVARNTLVEVKDLTGSGFASFETGIWDFGSFLKIINLFDSGSVNIEQTDGSRELVVYGSNRKSNAKFYGCDPSLLPSFPEEGIELNDSSITAKFEMTLEGIQTILKTARTISAEIIRFNFESEDECNVNIFSKQVDTPSITLPISNVDLREKTCVDIGVEDLKFLNVFEKYTVSIDGEGGLVEIFSSNEDLSVKVSVASIQED